MGEWPLVGRGDVLGRLVDLADGPSPTAVVLAGPAGVGKTRIAREVAARAAAKGTRIHTVVGTRAAATIPFAAFAGFVPPAHTDLSPLGILGVVRSTLADATPPALLVVDDAQRLDQGSAALVHQLVGERICSLLATVRAGEPAPDAVAGLWKDALAERIELAGLRREQVDQLVAAVLGGPVEGATLRRIWVSTQGNLLFLHELLLGALGAGSVREQDGVWRLAGDAPIPARLAELIAERLSGIEPAARAALDVIAVAERIDLDVLGRLVPAEAVDELERLGFVDVELDPALAALRHPLFGEAVRAELPALRRRRLCGQLAGAVEAAGLRTPSDLVRVATWRLESGGPADPALLTAAAQRAWMTNDLVLAERLATAAREAGAGVAAGVVAADVALVTGRSGDALAMFERLAPEASTDEERVHVAAGRAHVLAGQLDREDEAIAILEAVLETIDDVDLADGVRCRLGAIHALAPRPQAALDAVRPVLERPGSPSYFRATYAAAIASAVSGRLEDAVRIGRAGFDVHRGLDEVVRRGAETQHIGPILAWWAMGELADAAALAAQGYDAAVTGGDAESQATFALLRGVVALRWGRAISAGELFREALAVNRQINDVVGLRWALGGVALAAGHRGDRSAASAAATELDSVGPLASQVLELDLVERGGAWALIAGGETSDAVAMLRSAADRAAATEQAVAEATLRHDLVRLGQVRAEQQRLGELAAIVDGPLTATMADHARALAARDAGAVDGVARRFAEHGCAGLAAEAASVAKQMLLADGERRRAASAEAFALEMLAACEGASSPLVGSISEARLTAREREIATLAAKGLSNRDIADRLVVSVRTVENHLARVFVKLGVTSRQDLARVVERRPS
jgi:DNA-binding CsgD family transcriptional regulator